MAITITLGAVPLAAQDAEKDPDRALRLLPVGRESVKEYLLTYPMREVETGRTKGPPKVVICLDQETGQGRGVLRLKPFRFSEWVGVRKGLDLSSVELNQAKKRWSGWHRLAIPDEESRHYLGILVPNPGWAAPKSLVVADDLKTFPAGALRVVNVSPYRLRVAWGRRRKGRWGE